MRERLERDEAANGAGSVVLRAALRCARLSEHRRATAQREQLRTPAGRSPARTWSSCRSCSARRSTWTLSRELADVIEDAV